MNKEMCLIADKTSEASDVERNMISDDGSNVAKALQEKANEKLVNRIYNVKKILKRYKKERSALSTRLDELGDTYRDAYAPAMWAEGDQEDEADASGLMPDEEIDQAVASIPGFVQPKLEVIDHVESAAFAQPPAAKKGKKVKSSSPYMIFCTYRKAAIQQEHLERTGEEPSRAELTMLLSLEWAKIPPEQKQVYVEISEKKRQEGGESSSHSVLLPQLTPQALTGSLVIKQETQQHLEPVGFIKQEPLDTVQTVPGLVPNNAASFH